MGICAFFYMWNLFGVVVFQRSLLDCRRVWRSVCYRYKCILLSVKLIWCSGFPEIYAWLERGWGQSSIGISAFFYLWNCIWCSCFPEICAWLEKGVGSVCNWRRVWCQSMGICAFFYLWNLFGVVVFQRSMLDWRRGWGQSAMVICAFFYLWNLFGVMVLQRSMLGWRRGHRVSLPLVYVHSSICETYLV